MIFNKTSMNLYFFIIIVLIVILVPCCSNEKLKELIQKDIINNAEKNKENKKNDKSDEPPPTDDNLIEEIQAAMEKRDKIEIECQQKKIYVIALGILSGIFLTLLIIYGTFKCYIFCLSNKENNTSFRRIRISKLGQVYLEDNFDLNKTETKENNNSNNNLINENENNDNNDAPTCFSVNKKQNTFNPDNYDDNIDYNKPYKIDGE